MNADKTCVDTDLHEDPVIPAKAGIQYGPRVTCHGSPVWDADNFFLDTDVHGIDTDSDRRREGKVFAHCSRSFLTVCLIVATGRAMIDTVRAGDSDGATP